MCSDDGADVAGVLAFNSLKRVGRSHLYSQFNGGSLPEDSKIRGDILLRLNFLRARPQREKLCTQVGSLLGTWWTGPIQLRPVTCVPGSMILYLLVAPC